MNKQDTYYLNNYNLLADTKIGEGRLVVDAAMQVVFDSSRPTWFVDVDHTILSIAGLKRAFSEAFAQLDSLYAPDVWERTYSQAKRNETLYDMDLHMQILSELSKRKYEEDDLKDVMDAVLARKIPSLLYPSMLERLKKWTHEDNVCIVTAGQGTYQKMKLRYVLDSLAILPNYCVYVENMSKGEAFKQLETILPDVFAGEILVVDDNPLELESIVSLYGDRFHLVRVMQPDGAYVERELPENILAEVWDFRVTN